MFLQLVLPTSHAGRERKILVAAVVVCSAVLLFYSFHWWDFYCLSFLVGSLPRSAEGRANEVGCPVSE